MRRTLVIDGAAMLRSHTTLCRTGTRKPTRIEGSLHPLHPRTILLCLTREWPQPKPETTSEAFTSSRSCRIILCYLLIQMNALSSLDQRTPLRLLKYKKGASTACAIKPYRDHFVLYPPALTTIKQAGGAFGKGQPLLAVLRQTHSSWLLPLGHRGHRERPAFVKAPDKSPPVARMHFFLPPHSCMSAHYLYQAGEPSESILSAGAGEHGWIHTELQDSRSTNAYNSSSCM
ncbi:hypothetical protein SRHO_G00228430 [Serrasalmus rhombeus]